jgi:hypothetical protein
VSPARRDRRPGGTLFSVVAREGREPRMSAIDFVVDPAKLARVRLQTA